MHKYTKCFLFTSLCVCKFVSAYLIVVFTKEVTTRNGGNSLVEQITRKNTSKTTAKTK